ncbi:MAG: hypothetical protein SCALA702_03840 [Melioribacteraceae bacterium]|nr:MAG: hypothetical protein SCALA702_03840 [Melioribacteraceae bacterium]
MVYTIEVEIQVPREKVIELFDSSENIKKWQPTLVSFEHISGEPGQPGAKSKMVYKMGKGETEMTETIVTRNFPDTFDATYETKGVKNYLYNKFEEIDANTTKWSMTSDFRFAGLYKLMGWLMPGAFKKETRKSMEKFKEFAEKAVS